MLAEAFVKDYTVKPLKLEEIPSADFALTDEQNKALIEYILPRLQSDLATRSTRIQRYARIDRAVVGWQKLTKEDSVREQHEQRTGIPQGITTVIPVMDMHVEETAAFFAEIFAPSSGNFYSNQGEPDKVEQITELADAMERDFKLSGYYDAVAGVMRSELKYNAGGFRLSWRAPNSEEVGADRSGGNIAEQIDLYNFLYDPSVDDLKNLSREGEWAAMVAHRNRLWLYRGAENGRFGRVDKVFAKRDAAGLGNQGFDSTFYKYPPSQAGIADDGSNEGTGEGNVDWAGYGASLAHEVRSSISGYEVVEIDIWLNPKQFSLSDEDGIKLYRLIMVDSENIICVEPAKDAVELPYYSTFLRGDELKSAMRSYAESIQGFQRHISFMANTAIAIERGNTYGQVAVDTMMFDPAPLKNGETAVVLTSKVPGRDVRTGLMKLNTATDTGPQYAAIGNLLTVMKEFFPSQGLPAQVAGIDRAVTSQVAAVMIGAVRRLHMLVKRVDSTMMGPMRVASYRNYVAYSPDANKFGKLTEKEVAKLLNSGLGQLNREVAAGAIERLLFTLIQNPQSAAGFDLPLLFRVWSQMLNTGTDLGKMVSPQASAGMQSAQEPIDPNAGGQPIPAGGAAV